MQGGVPPQLQFHPAPRPAADAPVAVVDLGSNSTRVVVLRLAGIGHLEVLGDARAPLRLVRELDAMGRFSARAVERVVRTMADFQAVAQGTGAARMIAVATAAVREAANGPALIARLRAELGIDVSIITAEQEAAFAFLGAINSLPVDHGMLVDLGGGSMQIIHFRDRQVRRVWPLPLGSLRLSGRFLSGDPPAAAEVRRLVEHVRAALQDAGVPKLRHDEQLIGTGGTFRNLGKIDRRAHAYPLSRLHGYTIARRRLKRIAGMLAARRAAERALAPGLNRDRVDSIVGGALTALTVAETVGAAAVIVSGAGLREGLALHAYGRGVMPADAVRTGALAALCSRFATWEAHTATRRSAVARSLLAALAPDTGAEFRAALEYAAVVLDIGRSIDYYNRHEHAAQVLAETDLGGFSHRGVALLAATVLLAGQPNAGLKEFRPLVAPKDEAVVQQMAAVLALADALVHRLAPGQEAGLRCDRRGGRLIVAAPLAPAWNIKAEGERIRRHFGCEVLLQGPGGA